MRGRRLRALWCSVLWVCVCVCVCERERERAMMRAAGGWEGEREHLLPLWLSVVLVTFSWEAFELSTLFEPSRTKVGLTVDNTLSFCLSLCLSLLSQRVRTCWASTSVLYDGLFLNLSLGNWGNFESFLCFCNALKLFIFSSTCLFWTLRKKETPDTKAGRKALKKDRFLCTTPMVPKTPLIVCKLMRKWPYLFTWLVISAHAVQIILWSQSLVSIVIKYSVMSSLDWDYLVQGK